MRLFEEYWPYVFAFLSFIFGISAAVHATMKKEEVRTAIGWIGVIVLSPVLGAVVYAIFGINRIRRKNICLQRKKKSHFENSFSSNKIVQVSTVQEKFGQRGVAMQHLGDRIGHYFQNYASKIEILRGGDETYTAMLDAIQKAKRSVLLETYIFDSDEVGKKFVKVLTDAVHRGVEVRVLIDAVGARYSFPSIVYQLKKNMVPIGVFNGNIIIGLRLPYANLRTHRKILVVDGTIAFTGGINIRAAFSANLYGKNAYRDTHFCLEGKVLVDLFQAAAEDWYFASGEKLEGEVWAVPYPPISNANSIIVRLVISGPDDRDMETNQRMLIGAFSLAKHTILIKTPYLLPDRELVSALVTAARRGVVVDIIVPQKNNLLLVNRAMHAQFDQLLRDRCRIWQAPGPFDHSKLISVDGYWAFIGSSNIDPRSFRLNFEVDLEIMDKPFAKRIANEIEQGKNNAREILLDSLEKRPFFTRLLDRIIWLGSPYL